MSFYDFYHKFFSGIGGNIRPPEGENYDNFGFNKAGDPIWKGDESDKRDPVFDLKIITDPFEMHQIFEQKLNEIMETFMGSNIFPGIQEGFGPDVFDSPSSPADKDNQHLRDFYLKPRLGNTAPSKDDQKNSDEKAVSGPITSWLDRFLPPPDGQVAPPQSQPRTFSSFRSVVRKSVTLPDGTVKTEEVIRDSDGTEQKTESHTLPDGSSSPTFDSPFMNPDISGLFDFPKWPEVKKRVPRDQYLKPGYERLTPDAEKVDKDLDKQILQSGIESLPSFTKEPEVIEPNRNFTFRNYTKRIVTLPSGVVETEEVMRNADGTEQRTVTQTLPDGTMSVVSEPTQSWLDTVPRKKVQLEDGYNPALSLPLKSIKDLIDILFK